MSHHRHSNPKKFMATGKGKQRQVLEVEDEEERRERLGQSPLPLRSATLLMGLTTQSDFWLHKLPIKALHSFPLLFRKTRMERYCQYLAKVAGCSETFHIRLLKFDHQVLARVQAFLPEMERANAELEQRTKTEPSSVVIENNTSGSGEYIEMVCIDLPLWCYTLLTDFSSLFSESWIRGIRAA
jgi:hypothetical protein